MRSTRPAGNARVAKYISLKYTTGVCRGIMCADGERETMTTAAVDGGQGGGKKKRKIRNSDSAIRRI